MSTEQTLTADIKRRVDYWLNGPFDEKTKEQVRALQKSDPPG